MNFLDLVYAEYALRRERVLRDRQDPLYFSELELLHRYRLPRAPLLELIDLLRPQLQHPTQRKRAIPVELQVCLALRFYATGSFLRVLDDTFGCCIATASRAVADVS